MTFEEAMKRPGVRLTNGNKWLVWGDSNGHPQWEVFQRPKYARQTLTLCSTSDLNYALQVLTE